MARILRFTVLAVGAIITSTTGFSLKAQTWSERAPNPITTHGCASAVVNNKIYVTGGQIDPNSGQIANTECYDPSTNTWDTNLAPIPIATRFARAVSANNMIYVIGGGTGSVTYLSANQCYNPTTNTWTELASMPTARASASVIYLNNLIYVIGGEDNGNCTSTNECYNIASNTWTSLRSMPGSVKRMSGGTINGIIYVMGGVNDSDASYSTESYNPANNSWSELAALPSSYSGGFYGNNGACVISDRIFIICNNSSDSNFEYIPSLNKYYTTPPPLTYSIDGDGITEAVNGTIYVVCGNNSGNGSINESYEIEIPNDTVIVQKTSPIFYGDTSITIDTSVTNRDTVGINKVTNERITTTIAYWQYYYTTTIDSIFTIGSSKVLDSTFSSIDTTSTRKQTTTNQFIVDTTILLPHLVIRDTVFARDTLVRTVDTMVQGKDTTIIITHSLVLLITKRDTIPDTAVAVILRDTLVHSGDTTIQIIDTSVIPFVLRDIIVESDSITYTLRDTTIIGNDTIIRIHDTTVLANSSVYVSPVITSEQFTYIGNSFDFASSDHARELRIYDMIGRCCFSTQITPDQTSQPLPNLQSGAYIASLGNQTLKFIRIR